MFALLNHFKLYLFNKFNKTTINCNYEWILGRTNKGYSPESARTDNEKTYVYLHQELTNLKSPENLLGIIHNHVWGLNLLLSEKDLNLYLSNNVKYGITTNDNGLLIIKNNNEKKLSNDEINDILDNFNKLDIKLVERFKNDKNVIYDRFNENHKYLLNEYVKDTFDDWVNEYESLFSRYNIKVKFINAKNINTS